MLWSARATSLPLDQWREILNRFVDELAKQLAIKTRFVSGGNATNLSGIQAATIHGREWRAGNSKKNAQSIALTRYLKKHRSQDTRSRRHAERDQPCNVPPMLLQDSALYARGDWTCSTHSKNVAVDAATRTLQT